MQRDKIVQKSGRTQAAGVFTVDMATILNWSYHQVQVDVDGNAVPAAGTLYIDARTPGANYYVNVGSIDMTGASLIAVIKDVCCDTLWFRPVLFDSGKIFAVTVFSRRQ